VAVPGDAIAEALGKVTGLGGQVTIDATNLYGTRDETCPSLSRQIRAVIGGPTAKSFSTVFAAAYREIDAQRATPSNLFAAEPAPGKSPSGSSVTRALTRSTLATSLPARGCWRTAQR
jgi:hypothetical protein